MSFGFSVGDFLAVGNLAWKVYCAFKDCPAVFQGIAYEASATHIVIKRLEDEARDQQSMLNRCGPAKNQELRNLMRGLWKVLEELDGIVVKYQQGRRISNSYRMATKDLSGLRAKLNFHLTAINSFTDSLSRDTLARIETVLRQQVQEVREGRRADPRRNASAWKELEFELANKGIPARDVARYKAAIATFTLGCLSGKVASSRSLRDIVFSVKSRDEKASRDEETSSGGEMSSDEETSSGGEISSDEDSFSDGEASRNEESFSDEESSSDGETSRDEESSSDKEASIKEDLFSRVWHKAAEYAKKVILFE